MASPTAPLEFHLRPTVVDDLDWVMALERHADNREWVKQWTAEAHADAIVRHDREHWIVESPADERLGFLIGYDLRPDAGFYLKRIALEPKGSGLGRAVLKRLVAGIEERYGATPVWLCVYAANHRARACYIASGFAILESSGSRERLLEQAREHSCSDDLVMIRAPSHPAPRV